MANEKKQKKIIKEMQKDIDEATELMHDNIDQVLTRGEKLEDINIKSKAVEQKSQVFNQEAKAMSGRLRFKNLSITAAVIGVVAGLAYGLVTFASWPFVAVYAAFGGVAAYGVAWAGNKIYNLLPSWPFSRSVGSSDLIENNQLSHENSPSLQKDIVDDFVANRGLTPLYAKSSCSTGDLSNKQRLEHESGFRERSRLIM